MGGSQAVGTAACSGPRRCARAASGRLGSAIGKPKALPECCEEFGIGSSQCGGQAVTKGRAAVVQQCVLVWGSRARGYAQRRTPLVHPDDLRPAHVIAGEARRSSVRTRAPRGSLIARQGVKMPSMRTGKQSRQAFRRDDAGKARLAHEAVPFSCTASPIRGQRSRAELFPTHLSATGVRSGPQSSTAIAVARSFARLATNTGGRRPMAHAFSCWPIPAGRVRPSLSGPGSFARAVVLQAGIPCDRIVAVGGDRGGHRLHGDGRVAAYGDGVGGMP